MRFWVWCVMTGLLASCAIGPSEEELACYQGCAREKDSCILQASTAQQIQQCDSVGVRCSAVCQ
jgi:hypothetical protein